MSDRTVYGPADAGGLPPSTRYDPRDPAGPGSLGAAPVGTVVLLLAEGADLEWAADAALELAAAWARQGRRIVLADMHLENPILHERAGTSNLEGVADIFLYGASLARSAQQVGGRGFYLIPAGTYAPDLEAIYQHPRWPKLVAGFHDANASLVLFTPAGGADFEALAEWVTDVVVLGQPLSGALEPLRARGRTVHGWLVPPEAVAAGEEPAVARPIAPPPPVPPIAHAAPPPPADRELDLPPPPVRDGHRRRGTSVLLWAFLALAVLGAIAVIVATTRPDLVPWLQPSRPAPAEEGLAGLAPPAPTPEGDLLPYSVRVKAFTTLPAAREDLAVEQRRFGDARFYVSPEEIQGILYYMIMAGAAPDSVRATGLRDRLVEAGVVDPEDAAGSWSLIQYTPLAFDLGEFDSPEEAALRADSLLAREIPTYSMVLPYSDGSRRWKLYGGAYRDSASAESLRRMLVAAGATARLAARTGAADSVPPP